MYEDQTQEVILERILDRISDSIDKREGSLAYDMSSPESMELAILYVELDLMIENSYGDTASREYLIRLCADRGITPNAATYAILEAKFTPMLDSSLLIGKRFNIGALNYVVTEAIDAGTGLYKVQCETAGSVGNEQVGQMLPIEYIAGLETATITQVLIPGEDEEDTEALRERYLASFGEKAYGGNLADYINAVDSIDGVGACKVTRAWNGDIKPAEMIPCTEVGAWVTQILNGDASDVVKAWLKAVYTAASNSLLTVGGVVKVTFVDADDYGPPSPTLVDTVQTAIDPVQNAGGGYGLAPIGHVVKVEGVKSVPVTITLGITYSEDYTLDSIKTQIEAAIKTYLQEIRKTWADNTSLIVRVAQIEARALSIEGVVDIVPDTKINGSAGNLEVAGDSVPVFYQADITGSKA